MSARPVYLLLAAVLTVSLCHPSAHAEKSLFDRGKTHWAFQPIKRPAIPTVRDRTWPLNPIDSFILARLEAAKLRPTPPADPRTLLRRVTLDVTGLPPTLTDQEWFLGDRAGQSSGRQYRELVDRLLASPAYGERWARHWLDVARYAETNGYERDGNKPHVWRYRDWVINALNSDIPYSQFVVEQVAGDEIANTNASSQIATSFLRLGTWDDEPANEEVDRYDQLDDILGTTTSAFLAQTVRCSRCHDHFFEPFAQKDYYRLLAVFSPLKRPQRGRDDLDRPVGTRSELATFEKKDATRRAELDKLFKEIEELKKLRKELKNNKKSTVAEDARIVALEARKRLLEVQTTSSLPRAYIWYEDSPRAAPTRIFRRGNPDLVGAEVSPGVPAVFTPAPPVSPKSLERSSGRRLWLANWLVQPDNPLTARVIVNRIWQWHFGRGIVATSNDFGLQGEKPTHPELLDWLASELISSGWSLKHIHRLILLSSTYQTSASLDEHGEEKLALFGRWQRRRLEAEAIRDGMMLVSGKLDHQMAGPSVYPTLPTAVLASQSRPGLGWGKSDEHQASRRSVYVFAKRSLALPELELLDLPDNTSSCEKRVPSTTAPQALTFLNGTFTHEQAGYFAQRLIRETGTDPGRQIEHAFLLALGRPVKPDEKKLVLAFLKRQANQIEHDDRAAKQSPADLQRRALTAFCLVLYNTNEFFFLN